MDPDQSGSDDRRDDRDEIVTMGVKGSEITIARNDGIQAWPTIVRSPNHRSGSACSMPAPTTASCGVARRREELDDVIEKLPGAPKGVYVSEVAPSRFDAGTVYATFDDHRQNDYGTYIYASNDFGQTWRADHGQPEGRGRADVDRGPAQSRRALPGHRDGVVPDASIAARAGSACARTCQQCASTRSRCTRATTRWSSQPTGATIWILDNLAPIQEFAAVQSTDAKLFTTPPSSMFRRPARDRNYEFWGDQTFFGENPPQAAVISWLLKNDAGDGQPEDHRRDGP